MVGQAKLQLLKVTVAVSCAGKVVVRFSLSNLSGAYSRIIIASISNVCAVIWKLLSKEQAERGDAVTTALCT